MKTEGVKLLFMPPASSHLNPVERVWSQVKRIWQKKLLEIGINESRDYTIHQIRELIPGVVRKIKPNSIKRLRIGPTGTVLMGAWDPERMLNL